MNRNDYYVLADGSKYYFHPFQNKNALLLGPSGSGKSTLGIIMNMLNLPNNNSCIVIDVKGQLYKKYKEAMEEKGLIVKNLSFVNPKRSTDFYNPLMYIKDTKDIVGLTDIMMDESKRTCKDAFWPNMGQIALNAMIAYTIESEKKSSDKYNLHNVATLLREATVDGNRYTTHCGLDSMFENWRNSHRDSWACVQYKTLQSSMGSSITYSNIQSEALSVFGAIETKELQTLLSKDTIDINSIGKKPTCLFVEVSDTDRSLDFLVNLFISQCMSILCRQADESKNGSLKIKTNFLIDDAGSGVKLANLESYISNVRSRNIAITLAMQSLAQLKRMYKEGKSTIMDSTDLIEVFGTNDIDTAKEISIKLNKDIYDILGMPLGSCFVCIRGESPIYKKELLGLDDYLKNKDNLNMDYRETEVIARA